MFSLIGLITYVDRLVSYSLQHESIFDLVGVYASVISGNMGKSDEQGLGNRRIPKSHR